jgi:transcriptional regulator with XRE-family HTH domain
VSSRNTATFTVPAPLWDTDPVLDALAARDIAQLFRLVQRETKVSQSHLGVATGLSQAQVSEIISGSRRVSSIDVLTRIASGLGMPSRARITLLLGERNRTTAPVAFEASSAEQQATEQELTARYGDVEAVYPSRTICSTTPPTSVPSAYPST